MTHCMLCTTEDVYNTTVSYISTSARTVLALPLKNVQLMCGSILYSTSELKWHTVCCERLRTSVIPHFLIFQPVRGQSSHCSSKTYSWRVVVYYILRLDWNNLCPIMHCFGDIAGFCAPHPTPIGYSTLFWGVFILDQIAHVGVIPSRNLKLFSREIIFEVFQPIWSWYLNVTDGQTGEQTDRQKNEIL